MGALSQRLIVAPNNGKRNIMTIAYMRRVLDRLERRGWSQWRQQFAYELLCWRYRKIQVQL
jgi:hypothetical protein